MDRFVCAACRVLKGRERAAAPQNSGGAEFHCCFCGADAQYTYPLTRPVCLISPLRLGGMSLLHDVGPGLPAGPHVNLRYR